MTDQQPHETEHSNPDESFTWTGSDAPHGESAGTGSDSTGGASGSAGASAGTTATAILESIRDAVDDLTAAIKLEPKPALSYRRRGRCWSILEEWPEAIADYSEAIKLDPTANAAYYIEILQEKYTLREIIKVCTEYAARSYDEQDEVPMLLDKVEQEIFEIAKDRFKDKALSMKDQVMDAIEAIEKLYQQHGGITGLATGFKDLDRLTSGLHPAEMIVIAARPSMGKTALAMNIAEHVAVNENRAEAK